MRELLAEAERTGSGAYVIRLGSTDATSPKSALRRLGPDELTGLETLPWQLIRAAGDGHRLILSVAVGRCAVAGAVVEEDSLHAHVDIYGRCAKSRRSFMIRQLPVAAEELATPGDRGFMVRRHAVVAVDLAAPVGARAVTGSCPFPDSATVGRPAE